MLKITHNLHEIRADVDATSEADVRRASMRALNRAAQGAITDGSRKIRERYKNLKKRDVDEAFSIERATMDVQQATVVVRGRPLSLARFLAGVVTERGKGGVWVNVKGQRRFIPHVWAQAMKNKAGGDYLVLMARVGKERYPVEVLKTIDIPSAFVIADVLAFVEAQSDERYRDELERSLKFLQSR